MGSKPLIRKGDHSLGGSSSLVNSRNQVGVLFMVRWDAHWQHSLLMRGRHMDLVSGTRRES